MTASRGPGLLAPDVDPVAASHGRIVFQLARAPEWNEEPAATRWCVNVRRESLQAFIEEFKPYRSKIAEKTAMVWPSERFSQVVPVTVNMKIIVIPEEEE
jgi:hypothetical protein